MIIDSHVHVGSWLHPDFLGRGCTLDETLATMSAAGVDGAVVMPSDRCDNAGLREECLRAAARGATLWLLPWVRPDDDLAWVRTHHRDVAGLKVHPSLSRKRITDDGFRPMLELAAELDVPVLVHCGRWTEIAGYQHAIDAAVAHPTTRFVFAHAGGDTPPNASGAAQAVHERKLTNVWFEFSGLREYWVIERNVALLGAERYMMGSDYPLAHPRMYLGALDGMALTDAQRDTIRGGTARAVYGAPLGGEAAPSSGGGVAAPSSGGSSK